MPFVRVALAVALVGLAGCSRSAPPPASAATCPCKEGGSSDADKNLTARPAPLPTPPVSCPEERNVVRAAAGAATAANYELLASCQDRSGAFVEALQSSQKALTLAIQERDAATIKTSRTRVEDLVGRIPHVTFAVEGGADIREVEFDDRPVPLAALSKKFSIDPGEHQVFATGSMGGKPGRFLAHVRVQPHDLVTVRIALR